MVPHVAKPVFEDKLFRSYFVMGARQHGIGMLPHVKSDGELRDVERLRCC
jgi:hypothetical protein